MHASEQPHVLAVQYKPLITSQKPGDRDRRIFRPMFRSIIFVCRGTGGVVPYYFIFIF